MNLALDNADEFSRRPDKKRNLVVFGRISDFERDHRVAVDQPMKNSSFFLYVPKAGKKMFHNRDYLFFRFWLLLLLLR